MRRGHTQKVVGHRVRTERMSRGIGVLEFAGKVGWDRWTLWRVETGRRSPTLEEVEHLAKALGLSASYLLSGKEAA